MLEKHTQLLMCVCAKNNKNKFKKKIYRRLAYVILTVSVERSENFMLLDFFFFDGISAY